jgi:hypothetical protein
MSSERLSLGVLVRERVKLFCEWQCVNVVSLGLVGALGRWSLTNLGTSAGCAWFKY